MKGHKLTLESAPSGVWGWCKCGWSTGPKANDGAAKSDHRAHVLQERDRGRIGIEITHELGDGHWASAYEALTKEEVERCRD